MQKILGRLRVSSSCCPRTHLAYYPDKNMQQNHQISSDWCLCSPLVANFLSCILWVLLSIGRRPGEASILANWSPDDAGVITHRPFHKPLISSD